jgi:hypothetical protein
MATPTKINHESRRFIAGDYSRLTTQLGSAEGSRLGHSLRARHDPACSEQAYRHFWMTRDTEARGPYDSTRSHVWQPALPMLAVCLGVLLLPWGRAPRSGVLGDGKYALVLAFAGLLLCALAAAERLDLRWWRVISVPLAVGCLALAVHALNRYGALGAIVTAVAAVAWLVTAQRRST